MGRKRHSAARRGPARSPRRPGITGTVRLTEYGARVETAEGSFRLTGRSVREVMPGDQVVASIVRGGGERRAVVEQVTHHAASVVVGTYAEAGPLGVVKPLDHRIRADFFIMPGDRSAAEHGVHVGDVVAARILSYPARHESGVVTVERLIGSADAPGAGIACVMARYDLPDAYPEGAERAAAALALDVDAALADPLRRDLRDRFVITIDPVDARDFDDAISLARTERGFELGVHIADVSHYVHWDDVVDLEARRRSTSVYLADRVLPMLPEALSAGLCSLARGVDRLAVTVDIELDAAGRVVSARMYPSVIRSRARLSYDQADALLSGTDAAALPVPAGGAPLADQVADARAEGADLAALVAVAHELAELRLARRRERGSVDFDTVEVHAQLDADGFPVALVRRERTPATSLVEEAMLLANECVADKLCRADAPAAFRVHEPPVPDHVAEAGRALEELGVIGHPLAVRIAAGEGAAMREAVEAARGTDAAEAVSALLLRAQQRAVYRPANEGHFALGAPAYCHFTSPIRRYPDLLCHRALKLLLARERLGARVARERASSLVGTGPQELERILPSLCRHASERERIADAAAHASQKVMAARWYLDRVGERASGVVSWMSDQGAFVRLDDTGAEGLVRMRDLGDEWFELDARTLRVTGEATGRTVALGDRVIVEVAGADPVRGHVDLKLVHRIRALH